MGKHLDALKGFNLGGAGLIGPGPGNKGAWLNRVQANQAAALDEQELRERVGMCSVCGGVPPVSGLPCICGGTGRENDACLHLREEVLSLEAEVQEWQEATDNADTAREASAEMFKLRVGELEAEVARLSRRVRELEGRNE
jgi:hypothetical protein